MTFTASNDEDDEDFLRADDHEFIGHSITCIKNVFFNFFNIIPHNVNIL